MTEPIVATNSSKLPKVTIIGAGNVGATAALLLLQKNLADVVLIDVAEGIARGKALDIMHMRSNELFPAQITGGGDYAQTANSDIVVVTAGVPRKPGMTREDLLGINAKIVKSVLENSLPASPNALYLFVTNPLDVMTNMAYSLASQAAAIPANRLMGMGGVLDTARLIYTISEATGVEPNAIDAMVIGAHGEAMLPLPRLAKVAGRPLPELLSNEQLNEISRATVGGGAAVVELLQTGSAFYAPASSIVLMVAELLQPSGRLVSTCARLNGEYGINDVHICVPAIIGKNGVEQIVELPLLPDELSQLQTSAESIKAQVSGLIASA